MHSTFTSARPGLRDILANAWQRDAHSFVWVIAVAIMVFLGALACEHSKWTEFWDDYAPVISMGTLAATLAAWVGGARERWRQSLPEFMSVRFLFQGKTVLACEHATIVGDPRALAQQIGRQMNGGIDLVFSPIAVRHQRAVARSATREWYMHVEVEFVLREWPRGVPNEGPVIWNFANQWGQASGAALSYPHRA
jgi:hypothetical protein